MLSQKPVIRFLAFAGLLYGLWFLLYEFVLKPTGRLDHVITENITIVISGLLRLHGYDTYYTIARRLGETYIYIKPFIYPVIRVGASCNGLELLVLYFIFILCYPGNRRYKIRFILLGLPAIHLVNILRNYILTLMAIHHYEHFEFFHRYVFIFVVYGFIFMLWMVWANKYSRIPTDAAKQ